MILDYKPYFKDCTTLKFVSALVGVLKCKEYNHQKMIAKLNKPIHRDYTLRLCATIVDYKTLIEKIFYRDDRGVKTPFNYSIY